MDLRLICLTTYGEEERCIEGLWEKNPKERDHLQDLNIEEKKILESILKTRIWRACAGLIWIRIGAISGRF